MSLRMKIGKCASLKLPPGLCCSRASSCAPAPTRRISCRKRSSGFGANSIPCKIARCFILPSAPLRSISLRRDARRARREATVVADADHSVAPQFDTTTDTQQALARAVDGLPAEQREVLVMKIWNELTFADIGTVLGISQNTAASRYRYALGALKKNLTSHE